MSDYKNSLIGLAIPKTVLIANNCSEKTTKILALIPVRMGSSRFPGKPMAPILGKPMIRHIFDIPNDLKKVERLRQDLNA